MVRLGELVIGALIRHPQRSSKASNGTVMRVIKFEGNAVFTQNIADANDWLSLVSDTMVEQVTV